MKTIKKLLPIALVFMLLLSSCGEKAPKEFKLSDKYQSIGLSNVYDLALDELISEKAVLNSCSYGDYLLLTLAPGDAEYYYETTELTLYSLSKGEVLSSKEFTGMMYSALLSDDKIAVMYMECFEIYDTSFTLLSTYANDSKLLGLPFEEKALYYTEDSLYVVNLSDVTDSKYAIPEGYFLFDALSIEDEKAYVVLHDENWNYYPAYTDGETMTVKLVEAKTKYCAWSYGKLMLDTSEKWYFADPASPDILTAIPKNGESCSIAYLTDKIIILSDFQSEMLEDGSYEYRTSYIVCDWNRNELARFDQLAVEGCTDIFSLSMDDTCRVVLTLSFDGSQKVALWDLSGLDVADITPETIDTAAIPQLIADKVQEIKDKYLVDIMYEEGDISQYNSGYTLTVANEDINLYNAVCTFEKCLSEYPEKLLKALVSNEGNPMQFYLGEDFIRENEYSIASPAAVTSSMWDYITVGFDISYMDSLRQNLAHELMHVFDTFIADYGYANGLDLLRYWEYYLNSSDYPFFYAYVDSQGVDVNMSSILTLDGDSSKWFIDSYARSYPTEDRARCFENLFMNNGFYFESNELMTKARFLCGAIRLTFGLESDEMVYPWEQVTGIVSDLSEFTDICLSEAMG